MTKESKLARVRAIIVSYNESNNVSVKIDITKFENELQKLGAVSEETLAQCSWEDVMEAGLPKILARQVAGIFRSQDNQVEDKDGHIGAKKASRMSYEELFRCYKPGEDDEVSKKLVELSKGKRVVVFDDEPDRVVNIDISTRLLQEIRRGFPEITHTKTPDGRPRSIFRIGEVPNDEVDENPLYPGRPLRSDETCDQTQRSWKGIPKTVRQLVLLATTKTAEAKRLTVDDAHTLMDLCLQPLAEEKLRSRWLKSSIMLDEMTAEGSAPRLKLKLGKGGNGDPFYRS